MSHNYSEIPATTSHRPYSKQGYTPHAKRDHDSRPLIKTQPQQYHRPHPSGPPHPHSTDPNVFQSDGLYFRRLAEKGTCEVAGMASARSARHLTIPAQTCKENLRVTRIGERAFARSLSIESIALPGSVTTIASHAFLSSSVVEIDLGGIQNIAESAFEDAKRLRKADLSRSTIKKLPTRCFSGCVSLESIRLPLTVEVVGEDCFLNCYKLRKAWLPPSVREVQAHAYKGCSDLKTFVCKSEQVQIHTTTFENTHKLDSFDISLSVRQQAPSVFKDSLAKCATKHPNGAVTFVDHLISVKPENRRVFQSSFCFIPNGVSVIGSKAFQEARSVKTLTIPETVRIIMPGALAITTVCNQSVLVNGVIREMPVETKTYPSIRFAGTTAQWEAIVKPSTYGAVQTTLTIHCKDGSVQSRL